MNILKNKKGFTVFELVLVLALLTVALGLGYNVIFHTNKMFTETEEQWIKQNEVITIADFVHDELYNSYNVSIIGSIPNAVDITEHEKFIYIDNSDSKIYFKDSTSAAVELGTGDFEAVFTKGENDDEELIPNVLEYEITSALTNYTTGSAVLISNMPDLHEVTGLDSGLIVQYLTLTETGSVPVAELSTWCFIATAAYGREEPSVNLLRRYRDDVLLHSEIGNKIVHTYYSVSPPIANVIAQSEILRGLVRLVLYPVVGVVSLAMNPIHSIYVVLVVLGFTTILSRRKKHYSIRL